MFLYNNDIENHQGIQYKFVWNDESCCSYNSIESSLVFYYLYIFIMFLLKDRSLFTYAFTLEESHCRHLLNTIEVNELGVTLNILKKQTRFPIYMFDSLIYTSLISIIFCHSLFLYSDISFETTLLELQHFYTKFYFSSKGNKLYNCICNYY